MLVTSDAVDLLLNILIAERSLIFELVWGPNLNVLRAKKVTMPECWSLVVVGTDA